MENNTLHKLGIDIGSTTVKVAVLDEHDNLLFSDYERHFANIRETLSSLIQKAFDQLGDRKVAPMITGSGGLYTCKALRCSFRTGSYLCVYRLTALCSTDRRCDRARR